MIYVCKPSKISLYVNTNRKTAKQIMAETGCDAIINGGLYGMSNFKPVCHLKVDGKVLAKDQYKYWGFGWNENELTLTQDYSQYDNYICCVCMVRNGKAETMIVGDGVGGSRPRTAIGVFPDGRVWLYAESSKKTPDQLQQIALEAGVEHAIMLDGGGSTQGYSPNGKVTSTRKVHNYICVWAEKEVIPNMTEDKLRKKVVDTAVSWLGKNENDGSFKSIIDRYNRYTPLPQGYKVKYTDEWCATFVSAVFMECDLSKIGLPECSCNRMVELYKKAGRWEESDGYKPKPGDIVMYDWQDSGSGDNTGWPDHVGLVVDVDGNVIKVIEGNKNRAVAYRHIVVNGKTIRGYCLPDYGSVSDVSESSVTGGMKSVAITVPVLSKGAEGASARSLQQLLTAKGYSTLGIDGVFGANTDKALRKYQKAKGLTVDGVCGEKTWSTLLTK